jgi:hypothetical protein
VQTYPLLPTLTQSARAYRLARVWGFCFDHVLVIEQKQREVYAVCEVGIGFQHVYRDEFGQPRDGCYFTPDTVAERWFAVRKCGKPKVGNGSEEGLYCIRIGPGTHHACECYGFNTHQHCKHIAALRDATARGII